MLPETKLMKAEIPLGDHLTEVKLAPGKCIESQEHIRRMNKNLGYKEVLN